MNTPHRSCLLYACLLSLGAPAALAQSIAPANDGTGTAVDVSGNQYDITGGSVSGDGANLFHSFERFGLTQAEIANFIADPAIQNILSRITGGNVSVIDGLLQVSGSGASLYLINPAGILFGPNSALNLDGSFTATTATGIGFGGGWLQAIGSSDYAALVGNPTGFAFAEGSGAIANAGNLAVSPSATLTLVGGAVINTGTLTAPSGQIVIEAVPGENLVRISQSGSLLSLELATLPNEARPISGIPLEAVDLPALLTGSGAGIAVNSGNTLTVPGSTVEIAPERGDVIVAGNLDVSGETGGTVLVLGDRVALVGADINASGASGGTVLVGGDYQGQGTTPTAERTYVSADSAIAVDALAAGDGGKAIVWADETTQFYGSVTARGGSQTGDGGLVEVSGRESLDFQGTVDATAPNGQTGTLLLDPNNIKIVDGGNNPADLPSGGKSQLLFTDFPDANVEVNNGTLNAAAANVVLQATGQITFDAPVNIAAPTVSLTAQANGSIVVNKDITTNQGAITLNSDRDGDGAGAISVVGAKINSNGGNVTLGGGADPTTGFAVGTTALPYGVQINSSKINSGGGDISLRGQQVAEVKSISGGVWIEQGSSVDSGTGKIAIAGIAASQGGSSNIGVNIGHLGNATVTSAAPTADAIVIEGKGPASGTSTNSAGVVIQGNSTVSATAAGGGIQITGTGGVGDDSVRNHGILLIGAGDATVSSNSGPVVLNGTASSKAAGIGIGDISQAGFGGTFAIKSATGDITLNTDSISVSEQAGTTFKLSSAGTLTIQPQTAGRPIEIGGVANNPADTLEITQKVLGAIQNGFSTVAIGQENGTGAITVAGGLTFNDPVILRSPAGIGSFDSNSFDISSSGSFTVQTGDSIVLETGTDITSADGQPLTVTLNADRDNNGAGAISVLESSISSSGGSVTLSGGNDPTTDFAVGTAALPHGVRINSSEINSGGGNISLRGQQAAGDIDTSGGVWIEKNSTVNSGDGKISIVGVATSSSNVNNIGVNIGNGSEAEVPPTTVTSVVTSSNSTAEAIVIKGEGPASGTSKNSAGVVVEQGAVVSATGTNGGIQITGKGGAGNDSVRNHGILLIGFPGFLGATVSTTSGPIVLNGTAGGGAAGIGIGDTDKINFGGTFAIQSNSGNITLNTDSISVSNQTDTNFRISSTGTLTIQPQTAGQPIQVGGTVNAPTGALGITQKVLGALQNGFKSIAIGKLGDFNPISIAGPVTFSDPVSFVSTFQVVTVDNPISGIDNASVTFAANTTNLNADVTTTGNAIAFQGRTEVGNAAVTVNAGSAPVTFSGQVAAGTNAFTVAADGISFDNLVSGSGNLRLQTGTPGRGIALGGAGVDGFLSLSDFSLSQLQNGFSSIAFGEVDGFTPIRVTGPVTFADPVTFAAGSQDITVDSPVVGTDNATITFDGLPLFLNADVTTDGTAIAFLGQVAVGSDVLIGAGEAAISFASAVFAAGNDLTLAADTINLTGPVSGSGNLTLQAGTPGLPIAVGGVGEVGEALALDNTRLDLIEEGFASITIGAVGSSSPINIADSVTFGDPVTFASASKVAVNGPVFGVGDATITFAANTTNLTADVVTENNAIAFQGQTIVGETVFVNAGEAAITFSGPVTAAGDPLTLTANEIDFGGPVSGTGSLTLQPATDTEPIVVAGSQTTSGLDLTLAELNQIQGGFSAVNIGRVDGSNEIRVDGSYTTANQLFLRSPNGSVSLNNPISGSSGSVSILGPTALTADLVSGNQPLTFDSPVTISRSITLNAGTSAIAFNSSVSAGANSLNLIADEIDFSGPVSGSGDLTLRPQSQPRISLGGLEDENSFSLSSGDLGQLQGGFSSITIGSAGSGQITVQEALTFSDPVTLQANTVAANGLTITGTDNASVTLAAAGGIASTGPVQISAPGDVTTGNITAFGQAVSLQSGGVISTGDINTSSPTLAGGAVAIKAQTAITAGAIDSSSGLGSGGSVLLDPLGDIEVSFINAEGGLSGRGGDITIATGRFFRATGSFPSDSGLLASLSSTGGVSGGTITLQHGGGPIPFKVGDAALNGTAAAITTGFSGDTLTLASGFRPIFDRLDLKTDTGRILIVNGGAPLNLENPCFENCSDPAINIEVGSGQEDLAAGFSGGLTQDPEVDAEAALSNADSRLTAEFNNYLGVDGAAKPVSLDQVQGALAAVPQEIPALLMVGFGYSGGEDTQTAEGSTRDNVPLELILVMPSGNPIFTQVPEASRRQVLDTVERLRRQISDPNLVGTTTYLEAAQELYRWIIAPLETTLADQGITNLAFVLDEGLRSLPIAALHTGKSFLIEEYSLGLIPSLNLVDLTYRDIRDTPVLIGGASEFATEAPLLAAPVEIETLQEISDGQTLANSAFTVASLKQARQQRPYSIVHLATHGSFARGSIDNSYLQFADGRLYLNQLRELNWSDPPVDLVTLSACQTAMGNREAELGFAGLAIAAGARSALASLWKVSDESTTGLMVEFYQQLRGGDIKATALQAAQLAMLRGEVYTEDSQLIWSNGRADLPPELLWEGRREFTHPFYWAAFTLVGSPW